MNPAAARRWLAAGAALAVAGWAVAFAGAADIGGMPPPLRLVALFVGVALAGAGGFAGWRGFARSHYLITPTKWRRRMLLTSAAAWLALSGQQIGKAVGTGRAFTGPEWWGWFELAGGALMLFVAVTQLLQVPLLVGGARGLTFPFRSGLRFVRVPWADIEQVVFSTGLAADTVEIGVALRPGAKPRRSSTRRHDVLTDLPCRTVVPRAGFDFAALQQLVAGHPEVTLVERSAAVERVWGYPGYAGQVRP